MGKLVRDFSLKYNLPTQLESLSTTRTRKIFSRKLLLRLVYLRRPSRPLWFTHSLLFLDPVVQVDSITDEKLHDMFLALNMNKFAKEAVPDILREMSTSPELSLNETLKKAGIGKISHEELVKIIDGALTQNSQMINPKVLTERGVQSWER